MSGPRVGSLRVGISASCPVTLRLSVVRTFPLNERRSQLSLVTDDGLFFLRELSDSVIKTTMRSAVYSSFNC